MICNLMNFVLSSIRWLPVCLIGLGSPSLAAELRYRIVDLGPIEGGHSSSSYGLNDNGDAVGHSVVGINNGNIAHSRPVVWKSGGAPKQLWAGEGEVVCHLDPVLLRCNPPVPPILLDGLVGGQARAINNAGTIIGEAQGSGYTGTPLLTGGIKDGVAFVWDESNGRHILGTLGGSNSEARGINDSGVVVGSADVLREFDYGEGPVLQNVPRAFVWDEVNGMRDLGTLGSNHQGSRGMGLNNLGQVVGWTYAGEVSELAFVWSEEEGMQALDGLAGPGSDGRAIGINDDGAVIGYSWNAQGILRAALWDANGAVNELGVLPGDHSSFAWSINENGFVVGLSETTGSEGHAFVWSESTGMMSLAELVVDFEAWHSVNVWSINERNEIVGHGFNGDVLHGFILMPIPEPTALTLLGMVLVCLASIRILRRRFAKQSRNGAVPAFEGS